MATIEARAVHSRRPLTGQQIAFPSKVHSRRSQRIDDPAEVEAALERNAQGQPAYIAFICSQFPVYGPFVTDPSARG